MKFDPNRPDKFLAKLCSHYGIDEKGGYFVTDKYILRIKTHLPNWYNFTNISGKLILSVYVPDNRDKRKPPKGRMRLSEFVKLNKTRCTPVQIEITPQIELHEAIRQINYIINTLCKN